MSFWGYRLLGENQRGEITMPGIATVDCHQNRKSETKLRSLLLKRESNFINFRESENKGMNYE